MGEGKGNEGNTRSISVDPANPSGNKCRDLDFIHFFQQLFAELYTQYCVPLLFWVRGLIQKRKAHYYPCPWGILFQHTGIVNCLVWLSGNFELQEDIEGWVFQEAEAETVGSTKRLLESDM